MEKQEPFRCMPTAFELPSNHLNTPTAVPADTNMDRKQSASSVEQKIPLEDPTPPCIAEATWDAFKHTLTLNLKGCNAIVVGKSTTVQCQSSCDRCSLQHERERNTSLLTISKMRKATWTLWSAYWATASH